MERMQGMPGDHRDHLLPLFWMRGEDESTLRKGVRDVHNAGCGTICVESRPHPDFLGDGWWHDVAVVLDECKRNDMKIWLLDDFHYPSGSANGAATGTMHQRMMMTERHIDVNGPMPNASFCVANDREVFREGEGITAVVAAQIMDGAVLKHDTYVDIEGLPIQSPIDITNTVHDGMAHWDVPAGRWRIFVMIQRFVMERVPPRAFVNPLMREGAQAMIDTIYEPHYKHFGEEFGKTILGFFTDESALRAGRGIHGVLGAYPMIPIPWRPDMLPILSQTLGRDARAWLPALWYEQADDEASSRMRYGLMDTVSRLYGENYAMPIGDWCREHGVSYIGHVIEQNNAHCRLAAGAGHYFRAISGQDMAGIDVVHHEIQPGHTRTSHAWNSQDFEADDTFFHSMLVQMAVSAAHLDPKKAGRTMCEIFGAYGWQEDMRQMRYLAHYMLARGVNYFAPHAFSMQPFPDADAPPHMLLDGIDPMAKFQPALLSMMSRGGAMLSGGKPVTRTGVLYYAEAEWACGFDCMKTQTVMDLLSRAQLEALVVPIDQLEMAEIDLLLVPHAKRLPMELFEKCQKLLARGVKISFVDGFPSELSHGQGDLAQLTSGLLTTPLSQVVAFVAAYGKPLVRSIGEYADVKHYPYEKEGETLIVLMNEDTRHAVTYECEIARKGTPYLYDLDLDQAHPLTAIQTADGVQLKVELLPLELVVICFTSRIPKLIPRLLPTDMASAITPIWQISLKQMGTDAFAEYTSTQDLFDLSTREGLSRFTGVVSYEAVIEAQSNGIDLGQCGGTVQLFADDLLMGTRHEPPYAFPIPQKSHLRIRVEVSNTLVHRVRDRASFCAPIVPNGMLGPVKRCMMKEIL